MRGSGIPARVVTGYQGGERNTLDGFWTVRHSDAHAWAEVWLAGQGWVRVDPTGAVSPGRMGEFQRLSIPRGLLTTALLGSVSPELALNLRAAWDAVNNRWNQWVLNYTQSRQLDLLRSLGVNSPSWEDLVYVLCGLIVAASLGGALWSAWERQQHDPWLVLLERARRALQQAGVVLPANSSPRQLAHLLQDPAWALAPSEALQRWLLRLEAWRYAPQSEPNARRELATLKHDLKRLLPLRPP